MDSKTRTCFIAQILFVALALPLQLAAQKSSKHPHQYHHYQLIDPGTFGGPQSGLQNPGGFPRAGVLNNRGTYAGWASTPAADPYCGFNGTCNAGDAFQYKDGVLTDLGRVSGGIDSQANWISENGLIAGLGDNGIPDPLAEFPIPYLHGILWANGSMIDLGTLPEGGNLVFPNSVNDRAEVVGSVQNTVPDPNTMFNPGYGTQSRAFYWKNGVMQDLGTLGTGTDAVAAVINERGQVVGWSYTDSAPSATCANYVGFNLTTATFLWDQKNGMRDIGGLGGTCTLASDLNNRGQVIGGSALTGDSVIHPFVWNAASGMTDLLGASNPDYGFPEGQNARGDVVGGTCGPVECSALLWLKSEGKWKTVHLGTLAGFGFAGSINNSGQVIGGCGANINCTFLWEDGGPMVNLMTLLPPNTGIDLSEAVQINDRGEIAVQGSDVNGNNHAVLLIPCDDGHPGVEGCDYNLVDSRTPPQSTAPRYAASGTQRPRQPWRNNRFHIPGMQPTAR